MQHKPPFWNNNIINSVQIRMVKLACQWSNHWVEYIPAHTQCPKQPFNIRFTRKHHSCDEILAAIHQK